VRVLRNLIDDASAVRELAEEVTNVTRQENGGGRVFHVNLSSLAGYVSIIENLGQ